MIQQHYVLGIYGNRTTDAVLVTVDGKLVAEESAERCDLQNLGFEHASRVVLGLVQKCCTVVSCIPSDLYAVALGLPGIDRENDRVEFQERLLDLARREGVPLGSLIVESNIRVALEAAFASEPGVVLMSDGSSLACGKGEDGKVYRAGGWGRLLSDEGTSFGLCREALNAAVRAHDGRGSRTVLLKHALEHFEVPSIEDLVLKVYRGEVDIPSFYPRLFGAEREGDHIAHGILFRGAGELADLVRVLTMQIRPRRKLPVCLMGDFLESEDVYSKMVRDKIIYSLPQVVVQKPKFPPAFGGIIMALRPFEFHK